MRGDDSVVNVGGSKNEGNSFLTLPGLEEQRACYEAFKRATSAEALCQKICVVCAREQDGSEGES